MTRGVRWLQDPRGWGEVNQNSSVPFLNRSCFLHSSQLHMDFSPTLNCYYQCAVILNGVLKLRRVWWLYINCIVTKEKNKQSYTQDGVNRTRLQQETHKPALLSTRPVTPSAASLLSKVALSSTRRMGSKEHAKKRNCLWAKAYKSIDSFVVWLKRTDSG